jgi:hypothetical protein
LWVELDQQNPGTPCKVEHAGRGDFETVSYGTANRITRCASLFKLGWSGEIWDTPYEVDYLRYYA